MTPEGKVKDKVKRLLKERGAYHYMPIQNGMGVVGIPDIIACVPVVITKDMVGSTIGAFVAVETKAPGKIKNTTANQKKNLRDIFAAHGVAIVADKPETVEDFLQFLLEKGTPSYYVP